MLQLLLMQVENVCVDNNDDDAAVLAMPVNAVVLLVRSLESGWPPCTWVEHLADTQTAQRH